MTYDEYARDKSRQEYQAEHANYSRLTLADQQTVSKPIKKDLDK